MQDNVYEDREHVYELELLMYRKILTVSWAQANTNVLGDITARKIAYASLKRESNAFRRIDDIAV